MSMPASSALVSPQPSTIVKQQHITVAEPWFTFIKAGEKTVEGRLCRGMFAGLQVGSLLSVTRSNAQAQEACMHACMVEVSVTCVNRYASFEQYLTDEGLAKTLPGVHSISEGVAVYHQFYTPQQESEHGVLAIHILVV
ncbi:MAG: hypothetical protein WDW36_006226 [Sanguina aurantia]